MEPNDNQQPDEPTHPRPDDRNEQVPGSPAPDPEAAEGDAGDVPEAD
jgi:hypothetical protein